MKHATPNKPLLLIGGTGLVGTPIAWELDDAGWRVRIMSRHAHRARGKLGYRIEIIDGDAQDLADVRRAMTGCQGVLICVSDLLDPFLDLRVTENVTRLARELGVERIILISGASVAPERRSFPMIDAKYRAEEHLKASPTPWVILRLTWPMESLARFVRDNRATTLGRQPATLHPVALADVGHMVSRAFELDEALGHTLTIHGPEAFTMKAWLEKYCALTGAATQVRTTPLWVLRAMATLSRNEELKAVVELMRYFEDHPEYGDPSEANRILGTPTTTTELWVAKRMRRQAA